MFKQFLIATLLIVGMSSEIFCRVLVITHSFNRPDFIEIQYKTFKKFLTDDYEFVVFNDAPDNATSNKIDEICKQYEIRVFRIPQKIHTYAYLKRLPRESFNHSCVRCANVVQYSLNEMGLQHDDLIAIIDSDMFLVKEFSIRAYMKNLDLAGVTQIRNNGVYYIWNGLFFMDMRTIPNKQLIDFNCGEVNNTPVDVGGQMHHYFKQTPQVKFQAIHQDYVAKYAHKSPEELRITGFNNPMIEFIKSNPDVVELYAQYAFVHYRAGGNWDGKPKSYHDNKTRILTKLIESIL